MSSAAGRALSRRYLIHTFLHDIDGVVKTKIIILINSKTAKTNKTKQILKVSWTSRIKQNSLKCTEADIDYILYIYTLYTL